MLTVRETREIKEILDWRIVTGKVMDVKLLSFTATACKKFLDPFKHGSCIGSRGIQKDVSIF